MLELPQKFICVGVNYQRHAEKQGAAITREPGDEITIEIDGVGSITNPVAAA